MIDVDDEEKKYHMVYRVYSNKERPETKDRSHAYGWTGNTKVLKAFLKQRDSKKYLVTKMNMDEITNRFTNHDYDATGSYMIDYIKLKSSKSGEEFHLFMTLNEMRQVEGNIKRVFDDICALDRIDNNDIFRYVNMVLNLNTKYYDALYYLGYRPKEISGLFDSYMEHTADLSYDGMQCEEYYINQCNDELRLSKLEDASNKILYSIESFVKVMRKDL